MDTYFDKYNMLHNVINPKPDSTTNPILFTGLRIVMLYEAKSLTRDEAEKFLTSAQGLYRNKKWYSNYDTDNAEFSHDNWTGLISALLVIMREFGPNGCEYSLDPTYLWAKNLLDCVPLFHWQIKHPKDFFFVWMAKIWPLRLFSLALLPFMIVSAWGDHKPDKSTPDPDDELAKTESKMLAMLKCKSLDLEISWWIVNKITLKKWREEPRPLGGTARLKDTRWQWTNWTLIFWTYFNLDKDHPNVILSEVLDE